MRLRLPFTFSAVQLAALVLSLSVMGGLAYWQVHHHASPAETNGAQALSQPVAAIAAVAGGLILLALFSAVWLARQWFRPLRAVQEATQRIARGDLAVRVPTDRSGEIGELVRSVNKMAESLESIECTRRRWMADLSHELRAPLATLRGDMDALIDGTRPLCIKALTSLREETLRLQAVVKDMQLLDVADPQALPCHFSPHDATGMVERILHRHAQAAAEAGLTLGWARTRPASLQILWDVPRIERVLNHVIQNSLQFTGAPGRIEVDLISTPHCVQLVVEDSEPSVKPKGIDPLFGPLYRVDSERSRHRSGRSLGLAVSAAIVHAHGGLISAHPSSLGGLRVEIDLPLDSKKSP